MPVNIVVDSIEIDDREDSTNLEICKLRGYSHVDVDPSYWDWIGNGLGRLMMLPVVLLVAVRRPQPKHPMRSIAINFDHQNSPWTAAPDHFLQTLASDSAQLTTGILLLDVLIANSERNPKNIYIDPEHPECGPVLFDHRQILCNWNTDQYDSLKNRRDELLIFPATNGDGLRHCLLDRLETSAHFQYWYDRINSLPDWQVESLVNEATEFGLPHSLLGPIVGFLLYRRDRLLKIVAANRTEFKRIKEWT